MADRHVLELRTMEVVTTCNGGPLRPRPCARPEGSPEYGSADFTKVLLMRLETHSARVCVCVCTCRKITYHVGGKVQGF